MFKQNKIIYFLSITPVIFILTLYGYLGSFTRWMADDYCSIYYADRLGLLKSIWYWRLNWSGRYSAFTIDWLIANFFNSGTVYLVLPILLMLWLFFTIAAIYIALTSSFSSRKNLPAATLLGSVFLFVLFTLNPDNAQSFYWINGMRSYALSVIALTFNSILFQLWVRNIKNRSWTLVGGIISFVLAFVSGGLSETVVVLQLFLLAFLSGLKLITSPSKKLGMELIFLLAGLLGTVASLVVVITAPGNAIRQSLLPASPNLATLIIISLQAYADFISVFLLSPEKIAGLIGAIFASAWMGGIYEKRLSIENWRIPIYLGGGIFLSFVCFPPGVFGYSEPPPLRVHIIPLFILIASLLYAAFVAGNLLPKKNPGFTAQTVFAMITVLSLGFSAYKQFPVIRYETAVHRDYANYWEETNQQILEAKSNGSESVTVPVVRDWAKLDILNGNPKYWVTKCYSDYYGIQVLGSIQP